MRVHFEFVTPGRQIDLVIPAEGSAMGSCDRLISKCIVCRENLNFKKAKILFVTGWISWVETHIDFISVLFSTISISILQQWIRASITWPDINPSVDLHIIKSITVRVP